MATMKNGYHYDMAKENRNKYSLFIDGVEIISNGTFSSVLQNFKDEVNYHRGRHMQAHIVMKKTHNGKEDVDEIVREF
jgi:hypothetical protein